LDIRYDGNLGQIVRGEQRAEEAPIAAQFSMEDFNLEQLNPFMPSGLYDIGGQASADVSLKGTLANPTILGNVTLKETEVAVSGLASPITHINATLDFSDKDFQVDEFQFDSGQGTATVNAKGTITSWNQYQLDADLESKKLALGLSGVPPINMDTKLDVTLGRTGDALNIDVRIGKTVLELDDWVSDTVKPAPTNPNTVLVEKKKRPKKKQDTSRTSVDFKVATTTPLRLTGSLLDTTWDVDFKVATAKGSTQINGKANVVRGSFDILGNSFNVDEADLIFSEAAGGEPFLNMIATTDFPDVEVKATIRGRISNPELTLTSIPSMSEADIFSLLLVGTTDMDQGGAQSANLLAGVASMKAPVMKKAMRTAGISQFSVGDAREGEGQVMSIGARLAPGLVMVVTINLNAKEGENESELRFKYDISRNWKFETGVGPAYSSVDFFWHVPLKHQRSDKKTKPEKNPDGN
jgi:translocation and assembly module TamB